jgi:hypothetical protein
MVKKTKTRAEYKKEVDKILKEGNFVSYEEVSKEILADIAL